MIEPYYETARGKLYLGDCLDIMPELEPVDLVVTSPPYNLGKPHKGSMFNHSDGTGPSPFPTLEYNDHDDAMPAMEYEAWQRQVLLTCRSILKNTGAIFYNHKPRIQDGICDDRKNLIPFPIRQEIIWDKGSDFNFCGAFFVPTTERIFICANPDWRPTRKYISWGEVWRIPPVSRRDNDLEHPAPFPEALAERAVSGGSQEGDMVLDPFMGAGTTAKACEILNRRWIGIEISEAYAEIAAKRIEAEISQTKLPGF